MTAILAILFFLAAVVVHGGFASIHSHWFDWPGLMLAGLLCLALSGAGQLLGDWRLSRFKRKNP